MTAVFRVDWERGLRPEFIPYPAFAQAMAGRRDTGPRRLIF